MNQADLSNLMILTACIKEGLSNLNEIGMKERLVTANQKIEDILIKFHENIYSK